MAKATENVIMDKTYQFALRIIKLHKYITKNFKEYVLSDQVYRSGTSIGANVNEAQSGVSSKDFVNKIGIAAKEARETGYWLRLIKDSGYLTSEEFQSLHQDCEEILKILNSIILTSQRKMRIMLFSAAVFIISIAVFVSFSLDNI